VNLQRSCEPGPGWATRLLLAALALLFCAAPVPGDVGGCGQQPQALDAPTFFASKQAIDCRRCTECSLESQLCTRACADSAVQPGFPEGCLPLVHDGEVCLRALLYASCDDYAQYMDDRAASVPTECAFCPEEAPK
jgi:hypothetical protein